MNTKPVRYVLSQPFFPRHSQACRPISGMAWFQIRRSLSGEYKAGACCEQTLIRDWDEDALGQGWFPLYTTKKTAVDSAINRLTIPRDRERERERE